MDQELQKYFREQGVSGTPCQADVVLAYLRMGRTEDAEKALGRPITRCPAGIPPWPPRAVPRGPAVPKLSAVRQNPCLPTTDAFRRYAHVKVGMTETQLFSRGITRRDVTRWTRLGYLEWLA